MRNYSTGGSDPKITIEQLNRMITNGDCPDIFHALLNQVNMRLDRKMLNAATVEQIQRMKGPGKGWQISLFTDESVLQVTGDSAYRYAGDPPSIKLTQVTALYKDGTTQNFSIGPIEPQSSRGRSPRIGGSVLNLQSQARRRRAASVKFDSSESRWTCACLYRNELYCDHILAHLAASKDLKDIKAKSEKVDGGPISSVFIYPVANGLAEIETLLTVYPGRDLDLDDQFVYHLAWDGFEQWLAEGDSGVTLVHQIESAVESSTAYQLWYKIYTDFCREETPHIPHKEIAEACTYPHHRFSDSKMVLSTLMEHEMGLSSALMANGFASLFHRRCYSCWRAVNMHEMNLPDEDAVPSRMAGEQVPAQFRSNKSRFKA